MAAVRRSRCEQLQRKPWKKFLLNASTVALVQSEMKAAVAGPEEASMAKGYAKEEALGSIAEIREGVFTLGDFSPP